MQQQRAILIRRLIIAFVALLLVLGVILFIYLRVFHPQSPIIYINTLSVSNFNFSNNRLAGNWDIQLQFQNPNSKMWLYYDSGVFSLGIHHLCLYSTHLQLFDQGAKDETLIKATLSASISQYRTTFDWIMYDIASRRSVHFDLWITYFVTFGHGVYRMRRKVEADCGGVELGVQAFHSSGNLVGSAMRCRSSYEGSPYG